MYTFAGIMYTFAGIMAVDLWGYKKRCLPK